MTLVRDNTFGVLAIEPSGPYGLLDVLTPREHTRENPLPWFGEGVARSVACGDLIRVNHHCPVPAPEDVIAKRFDGVEILNGELVAIQGGVKCSTLGLTGADALAHVENMFQARESVAVEREFLAHALVSPNTEDLTPDGGPVSAEAGLAWLEGYGISRYGGKPYLHVPSTIGSYLFARGAGKIEGYAKTKLGNPLVVGGGYDFPSVSPSGVAAAEGSFWLYVTGQPIIARGPLNTHEAPNLEMNEEVALAERQYLVGVDCFAAAINVTLEGWLVP